MSGVTVTADPAQTSDPGAPSGRRLLAVVPVDHPGGANIGLLRLLSRLGRCGQITVTSPGPGRWRTRPRGPAIDGRPSSWAILGPRTGAWGVGSGLGRVVSPANANVTYLNGGVCGRLSPALPGGEARRVHPMHDIVA